MLLVKTLFLDHFSFFGESLPAGHPEQDNGGGRFDNLALDVLQGAVDMFIFFAVALSLPSS